MMIVLLVVAFAWSSVVAAGAGMALDSMLFTAITSGLVCMTLQTWNPNHQLHAHEGGDELLHLGLLVVFVALAVGIGITTSSYVLAAVTPPSLSMLVLVLTHAYHITKLRQEELTATMAKLQGLRSTASRVDEK